MTVTELMEELTKYPGDMLVVWFGHYDCGEENISEPVILMKKVSKKGDIYMGSHYDEQDGFESKKVLTLEYDE